MSSLTGNSARAAAAAAAASLSTGGGGAGNQVIDRRLLHNYRVVQRNLVYVIGIPSFASSEDTLRKAEFFGQYGKIVKIGIP